MNKQNYRYWATENPQELQQRPLHSDKLTVWWGIASFRVLGLYSFEDNKGAAVTVTSQRYVEMLRNFCEPELRRPGIDLSSAWLQQDGATVHTGRASMIFLREMFPQTSFLMAVTFHGLRVYLISPPVITFYAGISKVKP